jgi:hypothetical protein
MPATSGAIRTGHKAGWALIVLADNSFAVIGFPHVLGTIAFRDLALQFRSMQRYDAS